MRTIESKNFKNSETGATILNTAVKGTIAAKKKSYCLRLSFGICSDLNLKFCENQI